MHFHTLCKVEPGEDTTNIRTANIKGTFFTKKKRYFSKIVHKKPIYILSKNKKETQTDWHAPPRVNYFKNI
jgi:hypothetical protein